MKKILVTGASSFLGHHVMPILKIYATNISPDNPVKGVVSKPRFEILAPSSKDLNLLDRKAVIEYIVKNKPTTILHLAAKCGGIGANKAAPAEFIHDNLKMTMNLFDAIKEVNGWNNNTSEVPVVTHFYGLGSVCGYPKLCPVPFKEDDMWNGKPEETNLPYGESKRLMFLMQQAFRQQFGLKGAHLVPTNLYGEHDHFDLKNSHVMPALINKFTNAKANALDSVEIWGDGTPTREFLYAGDCADAIVRAVCNGVDYSEPINIGTGVDISISDLADMIRDIVDFKGNLLFTGEVSINGQPKRCLDISRAKSVLGFEAKTDLKTGLAKTIKWYQNEVGMIRNVKGAHSKEDLISSLEQKAGKIAKYFRENPEDVDRISLEFLINVLNNMVSEHKIKDMDVDDVKIVNTQDQDPSSSIHRREILLHIVGTPCDLFQVDALNKEKFTKFSNPYRPDRKVLVRFGAETSTGYYTRNFDKPRLHCWTSNEPKIKEGDYLVRLNSDSTFEKFDIYEVKEDGYVQLFIGIKDHYFNGAEYLKKYSKSESDGYSKSDGYSNDVSQTFNADGYYPVTFLQEFLKANKGFVRSASDGYKDTQCDKVVSDGYDTSKKSDEDHNMSDGHKRLFEILSGNRSKFVDRTITNARNIRDIDSGDFEDNYRNLLNKAVGDIRSKLGVVVNRGSSLPKRGVGVMTQNSESISDVELFAIANLLAIDSKSSEQDNLGDTKQDSTEQQEVAEPVANVTEPVVESIKPKKSNLIDRVKSFFGFAKKGK